MQQKYLRWYWYIFKQNISKLTKISLVNDISQWWVKNNVWLHLMPSFSMPVKSIMSHFRGELIISFTKKAGPKAIKIVLNYEHCHILDLFNF